MNDNDGEEEQVFMNNFKSEYVLPPIIVPKNFNRKKHPRWENFHGVDILIDPLTEKGIAVWDTLHHQAFFIASKEHHVD